MVLPMWAFWVALAAMLVGLLGVFLPLVPGVGLIWLVALVYAIAEGFATIDAITFAVLTLLGALGVSSDLWMSKLGAKLGGASTKALLAGLGFGVLGALLGLALGAIGAVFGAPWLELGAIPCAIVGALLGVFIIEYRARGDWREALKAGGGWLIGCTLSGAVQLLISLVMMALFAWQALKG